MIVQTDNSAMAEATVPGTISGMAPEAAARREESVSPAKMKALKKVADTALRDGACFVCVSRLGRVTLELRTNDYDLYGFWHENWFPAAAVDGPARTTGRVTVAAGVEGEAPAAYYCHQTGEATLLNTGSYLLCRNWALGLASDLNARESHVGLQAAAVRLNGCGAVVLSDDAALLTAFAWACGLDAGAEIQNLTWSWLGPDGSEEGGPTRSWRAERSFLVPTACVWHERRLRGPLDRAPTENLLRRKDGCRNVECLGRVDRGEMPCVFDLGQDRCFWSRPDSEAVVHEGFLPARLSPEEAMETRHVLFVRSGPEADSLDLAEMDQRDAASLLRRGFGVQAARWCTPQLFEPVEDVYRKATKQCVEGARAAVLSIPAGQLREGVRLFDDWSGGR